MYYLTLLVSVIFTILLIILLQINKQNHQIILFLCVMIFFILFKNIFRKMINYNKTNIYGENNTSPITNYSVNNVDLENINNKLNYENNINNINNINNLNNVNLNNNINYINNDFVYRPNNYNEEDKFLNMKKNNLQLISNYSPIINSKTLQNYNIIKNPYIFNEKKVHTLNNIQKLTDCTIDDGSCLIKE